MSKVIELTSDSFETEVLQSQIPAVVDFAASWCGPCRRLAPVIDELSEDFDGKAKICHLDVDSAQEIAGQYGIMSVPSVLFFKNGEKQDQSLGLVTKAVLAEKIQALL